MLIFSSFVYINIFMACNERGKRKVVVRSAFRYKMRIIKVYEGIESVLY